jgi:hypothetical protein
MLDPMDGIGKAGAAFRSLGDPFWDTSSAQGRLLGRDLTTQSRRTASRTIPTAPVALR